MRATQQLLASADGRRHRSGLGELLRDPRKVAACVHLLCIAIYMMHGANTDMLSPSSACPLRVSCLTRWFTPRACRRRARGATAQPPPAALEFLAPPSLPAPRRVPRRFFLICGPQVLRFIPCRARRTSAAVSYPRTRLFRIASSPAAALNDKRGSVAAFAASPTRVSGDFPDARASPSSAFPSASREVVGTSSSSRSAAAMTPTSPRRLRRRCVVPSPRPEVPRPARRWPRPSLRTPEPPAKGASAAAVGSPATCEPLFPATAAWAASLRPRAFAPRCRQTRQHGAVFS